MDFFKNVFGGQKVTMTTINKNNDKQDTKVSYLGGIQSHTQENQVQSNGNSSNYFSVGDFYQVARTTFENTTGGSEEVKKAQNNMSDDFKSQPGTMPNLQRAAQHETDHMNRLNRKELRNFPDKLAHSASKGEGFALRNIAARFIGGLIGEPIQKGTEDAKEYEMHNKNQMLSNHDFMNYADIIEESVK